MPSSKDIAAVPEADELYREAAQIAFGLQNAAAEKEERRRQKDVDRQRNPETQYQPKKGDRVGLATQTQRDAVRDPIKRASDSNPRTISKQAHELNKAQGQKAGQYYKSTVEGFKIKSLNKNNVVITRDGEKKAAFRRINGRTQVNSLTPSERKTINQAHSKQVKIDKGVGRGA